MREDIINAITISENSKQESKESLREKFISSIDFISQNLMNNYRSSKIFTQLHEFVIYIIIITLVLLHAQVGNKIGSYTWLVCIIYVKNVPHLI